MAANWARSASSSAAAESRGRPSSTSAMPLKIPLKAKLRRVVGVGLSILPIRCDRVGLMLKTRRFERHEQCAASDRRIVEAVPYHLRMAQCRPGADMQGFV